MVAETMRRLLAPGPRSGIGACPQRLLLPMCRDGDLEHGRQWGMEGALQGRLPR